MKLVGFLLLFIHVTRGQQELFQNPDFEEDFSGQENWWCNNCLLDKSTDAHQGSQSGRVTLRNEYWSSISQYVPVQAGRSYYFYAHVKVLNQQPAFLWHRVDCLVDITYVDGSDRHYHWVSRNPHTRQDHGWIKLGGDFTLGDIEILTARFYVQFQQKEVDYLIDTASLTELPDNPLWEQEADARIENIRKRDIEIRLDADWLLDPRDLTIEVNVYPTYWAYIYMVKDNMFVDRKTTQNFMNRQLVSRTTSSTDLHNYLVEQTRHEFAFGSAVQAALISGSDARSQAYQSTFYEMFEWAVLENALKWRHMEPVKGQINYALPEAALDALQQNGIPTRGHCVVWGIEANTPDWLRPLDGAAVRQEVATRIQGVVSRMRGRLVHWDVNNEQLHGPFFENKTGDHLYTETMFDDVRAQDPDVKLFFNEYEIVNFGPHTYAYVQQVQNAVANGRPVYGMGAQGHMPVEWRIENVEKRLDIAAEAGVPIWITEMTVQNDDRDIRAEGYEDLLRLYFSHPSVEGVLIWGFWDGAHYRPSAALVEGEGFQMNAAGLRYMELVHNEWRSDEFFLPRFNQETFDMRGFHGNYTLRVSYLGAEIHQQQFSVPKGDGPVIVNVVI